MPVGHDGHGPTPTLYDLVRAAAERDPDRTAVRGGGRALSYRELIGAAHHVAAMLARRNVRRGDVVAVYAPASPGYVTGVLGVLAAGAAFLPVDPSYPVERIGYLIADSAAAAVLHPAGCRPPHPAAAGVPAVALPEGVPRDAAPEPRPQTGHDDLAYVIYTSGSTGRPKGVRCHHRGAANLLADITGRRPLPGGVGTMWTSVSFDVSVYEIFSVLLEGGTLVVVPDEARLDPGRFVDLLVREAVSTAYVPPFMLAELAERAGGSHPPPLRRVLVGVEPIQAALLHRIVTARDGICLVNGYGPTENHICATAYTVPADGAAPAGRTPIGSAVRGSHTHLLGPDLNRVPIGEQGEIYVGGQGVAHGYHRRPGLTALRFVPDPYPSRAGARIYRTGDRARARADGNLMFGGRLDRQVKVRGHRVEPGEVEAVLERHPAVVAAAVMPAADDPDLLCGYVEVRPDASDEITAVALTDALTAALPAHAVPGRIEVLHRLPLTAHGKLDRAALARRSGPPVAPEPARSRDATTPDATERHLAMLWRQLLSLEDVGPHDSFLARGGHSLAAVRLAERVRREMRCPLTVAEIFTHPTLRELASVVRAHGGAPPLADLPRDPARPARRIGPLSAGQQALVLLHRMYPHCTAYHVPTLHELTGPVAEDLLRQALLAVVARHPALRVQITEVGGRLVQQVATSARVGWRVHRPGPDESLSDLLTREVSEPFDLAQGPLLRATLVRSGPERAVLLLVAHHVVVDGWSFEVLHRDLGVAYGRLVAGCATDLPPAGSFLDVAAGEVRDEHRDRVTADLAYWRRRLVAPPGALTLAGQARRPARPRFRADRVVGTVDPARRDRLWQTAQDLGVSPFALLTAALSALLSRYTGSRDFLVGTPVAGRDEVETDDMVGFLTTSLIVPCRVDEGSTVAQHVRATARELAAALSHRHAPFDQVVREVNAPRVAGANPLFQVWCNLLSYPRHPLRLTDCTVRAVRPPLAGALFDLSVYLTDGPDGLDVELVYDTDLFARDVMAALARHYRDVLISMGANPTGRVDHIEIGTGDPGRAPVRWPSRGSPARFPLAGRAGHTPAVRGPGGPLSYGELKRRVAAREVELVRGRVSGGVLAVLGERHVETVVTVVAALRSATTFALLDGAQPAGRLDRVLTALRPTGWIDATGGAAPDVCARVIGRVVGSRPDPVPEGTAYVAFTSGTTGQPRGVLAGAAPLDAFLDWYVDAYGFGPADRFALLSGVGHDPLLRDLLTPLRIGATLCVPPADVLADSRALLRWLAAERVTAIHLTPAVGRLLAAAGRADRLELPAVRFVGFGGAVLRDDDAEAAALLFPEARLQSFYGATETPQVAGRADVPTAGAVGTGSPVSQLLVCTDGLQVAPVNVRGEIVVRGPYLAIGYLDDPSGTAERFLPDPHGDPAVRCYRTGDRGLRRSDGIVVFHGRADRQVGIHGVRVELAEIEAVARLMPAVRDCVAEVEHREGSDELVLYVEADPARVDPESVRRHLAAQLVAGAVPGDIVVMATMPLSPHGKPDVAAMRTSNRQRSLVGAAPAVTAGSDDAQAAVRQAWITALDLPDPDPAANFFDLGGTSLGLLAVQAQLQRMLGRKIPLVDLFRFPSIRSLAAALASREVQPRP